MTAKTNRVVIPNWAMLGDAIMLSPTAVAEIKGCNRSTVQELIVAGEILATPIIDAKGKVVGYGVRPSAIVHWFPRGRGNPDWIAGATEKGARRTMLRKLKKKPAQ